MSSVHLSNRKGRLTQRLANTYPDWTDIRSDEQSTGFQLLNAIGTALDDLSKRLFDSLDGFQLVTTPPSDLGLSYKARLPKSFSFTKTDNDDTESNYIAPTVSGLYDSTYYQVSLVTDNNVANFWRDAYPSRLSVSDTITDPTLVDTTIVDDVVFNSPFVPDITSGVIGIPNQIIITTSGGTNYIQKDGRNVFQYGSVRITGSSRNGLDDVEEEITFFYDKKEKTNNVFSSISGVKAYNIYPSGTSVKVTSMDFNNGPYRTAYDINYSKDGFNIPTYFDISSGFNSQFSLLDYKVPVHSDSDIRLAGFSSVYADFQQRLVDTDGFDISAVDMVIQPNSDFLWVVTNEKLLCYTSELPYLDTTSLKGRAADPDCRIVTTPSDYIASGDTATVQFYWKSPGKGLERHRVLVTHEDGTKYAVVDGALEEYDSSTDYWIYGEPHNRWLRQPFVGTLPKQGLFTFSIESRFADESTEIEKRIIISDKTISPLAEYTLSDIDITNFITGIDIDVDNNIWLKDCYNNLIKLQRHYDKMIIDYEEKIIYLRENYDEVIINYNPEEEEEEEEEEEGDLLDPPGGGGEGLPLPVM